MGFLVNNPKVKITALCDIYQPSIDGALKLAPDAKVYNDYRQLLEDKVRYVAEYEARIREIGNPTAFDKQTAQLMAEHAEISAETEECIARNAAQAQNQEAYQKRYDALVARYEGTKARLEAVQREKQAAVAMKEKLGHFLKILRRETSPITAFDERLWRETVESTVICSKQDISVRFKSSTEIRVEIGVNSQ